MERRFRPASSSRPTENLVAVWRSLSPGHVDSNIAPQQCPANKRKKISNIFCLTDKPNHHQRAPRANGFSFFANVKRPKHTRRYLRTATQEPLACCETTSKKSRNAEAFDPFPPQKKRAMKQNPLSSCEQRPRSSFSRAALPLGLLHFGTHREILT